MKNHEISCCLLVKSTQAWARSAPEGARRRLPAGRVLLPRRRRRVAPRPPARSARPVRGALPPARPRGDTRRARRARGARAAPADRAVRRPSWGAPTRLCPREPRAGRRAQVRVRPRAEPRRSAARHLGGPDPAGSDPGSRGRAGLHTALEPLHRCDGRLPGGARLRDALARGERDAAGRPGTEGAPGQRGLVQAPRGRALTARRDRGARRRRRRAGRARGRRRSTTPRWTEPSGIPPPSCSLSSRSTSARAASG